MQTDAGRWFVMGFAIVGIWVFGWWQDAVAGLLRHDIGEAAKWISSRFSRHTSTSASTSAGAIAGEGRGKGERKGRSSLLVGSISSALAVVFVLFSSAAVCLFEAQDGTGLLVTGQQWSFANSL